MLQVSVDGFTPEKTSELVAAANFFAKQLMHGNLVNNLYVDITKDDELDVMAETINDEEKKNPRSFTIHIRDAEDDEDIVKTLAHEMVHVKQYAMNELSYEDRWVQYATTRGKHKKKLIIKSAWKGEIWSPTSKECDYWDSPWEIEAYGREVGLWHKWCASLN